MVTLSVFRYVFVPSNAIVGAGGTTSIMKPIVSDSTVKFLVSGAFIFAEAMPLPNPVIVTLPSKNVVKLSGEPVGVNDTSSTLGYRVAVNVGAV
jgi:hypothetical protein